MKAFLEILFVVAGCLAEGAAAVVAVWKAFFGKDGDE